MPTRLRVVEFELRASECQTRLPFRFGNVTMTRAPLLHARVRIETAAGVTDGLAADLLVPRWFDKDPAKSIADNQRDLIEAACHAGALALATPPTSAFVLVRAVRASADMDTAPLAPLRLRSGFGVALLERAVLDALCRSTGVSFFRALRSDLFGIEPSADDLADFDLAATLPSVPAPHIEVRHTVGMQDPLTTAEIAAGQRCADGLPQALEEDVRAYGLRLFKIKIGAGRAADLARLRAIRAVLDATAPRTWQFSVDANEQYTDLDDLVGLLVDLHAEAGLGARLLYVEQPLPRHLTFAPDSAPAVARAAALAPLLIDEADVDSDAFPRALELGYRGVSVKNCKGVLRAVINHARCARLRAAGTPAFQSAEDLTNLPVVALQQDLATIQALGLPHAERNGHHYFAGLAHLPQGEAAGAFAAHGDLYRRHGDGYALKIEGGKLAVGSLLCEGYGYACPIDFAARASVALAGVPRT